MSDIENKFTKIREELENINDIAWKLLILERDITYLKHLPNKHPDMIKELNNLLDTYRYLSMKLFGEVRLDRQEKETNE